MKHSRYISLYPLIVSLFIVCLLSLIISASTTAREIYTWTDEKGVIHITDREPDKPVKIIDKAPLKKVDQYEIRRFEEERRVQRIQLDRESEIRRIQYNAEARSKESEEQFNKRQREAELKAAKDDYEYWKPKLDRYKYNQNNAPSERSRLFWKEQVEDIEKKRLKIIDLENR